MSKGERERGVYSNFSKGGKEMEQLTGKKRPERLQEQGNPLQEEKGPDPSYGPGEKKNKELSPMAEWLKIRQKGREIRK